MGSSNLVCPMCCGETFNNPESLKYHLLRMTDNLYCPGCSERTYSIAALIQHLDYCQQNKNHDIKLKKNSSILMGDNEENTDETFVATVNESGMMILSEGRTIQVDENGEIQFVDRVDPLETSKSPVENVDQDSFEDDNSAEVESQNETTILNIKVEESQENINGLYSCNTCGMNFDSVVDHVREYHNGQEVELEMEDPDIENQLITDKQLLIPVINSCDINDQLNNIQANNFQTRNRQSLDILRTEECIDSEGRPYTRKVVQIERFWNQTPVTTLTNTKAPMIEKFFSNVEGVKVRDKSVTVAPTRMYRCTQCLEQFPKISDFKAHLCIDASNKCDYCNQSFANEKALQLHIKSSHDNNSSGSQKIFLCSICGTEFTSHKSLRLHSRMHAPVKTRHVDAPEGTSEFETFTCTECGKVLSKSYREAHMALHAGDTITCLVCNRKFDSFESLEMHAAVHNDNNQKTFSKDNIIMMSDISNNIPVNNNFEDPSTSKNTNSESDLQNAKPYKCQHCGRRFTRPHEKVKHERIHTGEKPHSCEVCGKTFRVSYCLTLHMRTHTGVRPYECKQCGKKFKASSVYNHHLLTHGDQRAYTCPYCPKTFKTRVQLAGHKNSHTKPFHCPECSRPFASLYAARAHIQTHKKDNNLKFSCYICGASYGRAFALKDHMKQHGEDANIPPEPAREEEIQDMQDDDIEINIKGVLQSEMQEEIINDVQETDNFLLDHEQLIVPSPPSIHQNEDLEAE